MGDSIIRWAAVHILEKGPPEDPDFKLGLMVDSVCWKGRSGRRLAQFKEDFPFLCATSQHLPSVILIHLGTNDIVNTPVQEIQWTFQQAMSLIFKHVHNPFLIFSEILPRLYYKGAINQKKVEKTRKTLNRRIRALMGRCGGHVIRHPMFSQEQVHLFRKDGTHLTAEGNELFLKDVKEGLRYFQLYPQFFVYPPFPINL